MIESVVIIPFVVLAVLSTFAAYRNGVNDGYMASKESWNPGYRKAVNILKSSGKWSEPEEEIKGIGKIVNKQQVPTGNNEFNNQ